MPNLSHIPQEKSASIFLHVINLGVQDVTFPGSDYFIITKDQYLLVKRDLLSPSKNKRLKEKISAWRLIALMPVGS